MNKKCLPSTLDSMSSVKQVAKSTFELSLQEEKAVDEVYISSEREKKQAKVEEVVGAVHNE